MGADNQNNIEDPSPLPFRIAVESAAAIISAASVAPAISIVDKAIVLVPSLINGVKTLFTNPVYFFKQPSFLFIWGVYSGTYIVANSIEAICERQHRSPFYPKFIGSSFANVSLSVLKDRAFARMFGKGDPRPMPVSSMGLFGVRDSMTILASFSLPPIISKHMQTKFGISTFTADTSAQLITPVSMQILSTPLHLFGLDLYNRSGVTTAERISFIRREYVKTTLARMARIFPAYGIGGVVNKYVRKSGNAMLFDHFNQANVAVIPRKM
eukprot:CAMPEP_0173160088 /NCGR_PEP_ID=MMETSP1105-20130129/17584_1 /TAXON_ID=2985 /ORGANISM="Ochromonas sp., Strain BG-1" /LENGTH=268 /DNA_ID=CAMNT_0014078821 /DNA_START=92 /DNA_END=898 /DNA_ORIENTATION=-